MNFLNYNGNDFLVAHFQGKSAADYLFAIEHLKAINVTVPENIQIITIASRNLSFPMLVTQLENSGIPYINPAKKSGTKWDNVKKIGYIRKALDEITTDYVLISDAADVLLTQDLTDIIPRFAEYGKQALFGATKRNYPDLLVDEVDDRDFRGDFRYLNAGTCFGKTEYLKSFYEQADYLVWKNEIENPKRSEQLIIRHVFKDETSNVDFDWRCRIFQTFGGTTYSIVEDENDSSVIIR